MESSPCIDSCLALLPCTYARCLSLPWMIISVGSNTAEFTKAQYNEQIPFMQYVPV